MPNHLAHESSPYLLQHQNNPVDWHPWAPAAIERAKKEDKPIFLSIGYSACHWCHVMEHESFENEPIAHYLNEHFISIKVDREERPDLDQIYMNAVQIMTGRGGWPMSVFLTPDLKPFYGGTYWPPTPKMGMPGFEQILIAVNDAWKNRRDGLLKQADELTGYLQKIEQQVDEQASGGRQPPEVNSVSTPGDHTTAISHDIATQLLDNASRHLQRAFDSRHGGFGSAPKFPHSMDLQLLLRLYTRPPTPDSRLPAPDREPLLAMVTLTLDKMAGGGIYDHLAGGFARYSVDERWLVPHFEKMLYDNALLTSAYLDAYLVTREERFADTVRETCEYILTYMTDPAGGFHSTEDADSEGEEGKFYAWTPAEIKQILGDKAGDRFCYVYDASDQGNFEHGKSILNLPKTIEQCAALKCWDLDELKKELAESRGKLLVARDQRVRPGKDDKILVSWNALMIDALARASRIVEEPEYVIAAEKAADFLLTKMVRPDGRLLHTWRHGQAKLDAYLDDYAYFINSLITLYEATFNERWIDEAVRLADILLQHFEDETSGGFFFTADDHEQLIARNKDLHDASVPSGNAMAATALLRLGHLTCGAGVSPATSARSASEGPGVPDYLASAERTLTMAAPTMQRMPTAVGQMLIALDLYLGPATELVLIGGTNESANQEAVATLQKSFRPRSVIAYRGHAATKAVRSPTLDSLFTGRETTHAEPTLYICQNFTCQAPIQGLAQIKAAIAKL